MYVRKYVLEYTLVRVCVCVCILCNITKLVTERDYLLFRSVSVSDDVVLQSIFL